MKLTELYHQQIEEYYNPKNRPYINEENIYFSKNIPSPKEVLKEGLRLIIIGEAGSGKTTFLDWTSYYGVKQNWTPVFISLRNYTSNLNDLIDVSISKITEGLVLDDFIEQKRIAFLFDGYDETSILFKEKIIQEIKEISILYQTNPIIITSRSFPTPGFADWKILKIENLSQEEIRSYILKYAKDAEFWNVVRQNPEIMEMASKPLQLSTMVQATLRGIDFREYLMTQIPLYTAWRGQTKAPIKLNITNEEIDAILARLALDLKIRELRVLTKSDILDVAQQLSLPTEIAENVAPILISTNVLTEIKRDRYTFVHTSYFESYAGRGLLSILKLGASIEPQLKDLLTVKQGSEIIRFFFKLLTFRELASLIASLSEELLSKLEPFVKEVTDMSGPKSKRTNQIEEIAIAATVASAYQEEKKRDRKDVLVFAIHGFNTRGDWKNKLSFILTQNTDGVRFLSCNWDYGRFIFGILSKSKRAKQVEKFHNYYNNILSGYPVKKPEICVVAHSFGTYIIAHAINRFPEMRFDRVIFLGSALPCKFNWYKPTDKIGKLLNIISKADFALRLAWFIPGLGGAGKFGFTGKQDWLLQHNEDHSEHSDLFGTEYIKEAWIPFLKDGTLNIR